MVINDHMITETYKLGKKVFYNEISKSLAIDALVEETGMNKNSATKYMACIDALLSDGDYGSTVKESAIEYFITKINYDFDTEKLKITLQVFERHLIYQQGKNNLPGMWRIYRDWMNKIDK